MRRLFFAALTSGLVACSLLFPILDDAASGSRPAGPEAGLDDSGRDVSAIAVDAAPLRCEQTGRGPTMVPAGDRLCIDATEVTADQYAAFVDAGVAVAAQIEGCTDNPDFLPHQEVDAGDQPVQQLDWCDAYAFCEWAGKKLCGAMPGYDAGADSSRNDADAGFSHGISPLESVNGNINAWSWACKGGERDLVYPYGNRLDYSACNTRGFFSDTWTTVPVASTPRCEGAYPGLFDMVGNASEWIDACHDGRCEIFGINNCSDVSYAAKQLDLRFRELTPPAVGFRCCGRSAPTR